MTQNTEVPRSDHEYLQLEAVNSDGRRQGIMIGVSYGDPVYFSLRFVEDEIDFSTEARDAFGALNAARAKFEPQGWRFLCNGARRDCHAFGAQLAADLGEQVFQLVPGRPAAKGDLVGIFEPADESSVGSLVEQQAHFERWKSS